MTTKEFIVLAEKIAHGNATKSEIALYNKCYDSFQETETSFLPSDIDDLQKLSLKELRRELGVGKRVIGFRRLIAAASIVLIVGISAGIMFIKKAVDKASHSMVSVKAKEVIESGKNGATLTLPDGKIVVLSEKMDEIAVNGDQLLYSDGTSVLKDDYDAGIAGRNIIASTAIGQIYSFTLSDGTKVWLNSASKLKFPTTFKNAKQRYVELEGEAYFEVFENKSQPFIVISRQSESKLQQEIRVLGTHFNVNAYGDGNAIITTLIKGSVLVQGQNLAPIILKPDQQSKVSSNTIKVSKVRSESFVSWKEGYFEFEHQDLNLIMKQISRWYNVDIINKAEIANLHFDGRISRKTDLNTLLKIIESTGKVKFKMEERRLIVMN